MRFSLDWEEDGASDFIGLVICLSWVTSAWRQNAGPGWAESAYAKK